MRGHLRLCLCPMGRLCFGFVLLPPAGLRRSVLLRRSGFRGSASTALRPPSFRMVPRRIRVSKIVLFRGITSLVRSLCMAGTTVFLLCVCNEPWSLASRRAGALRPLCNEVFSPCRSLLWFFLPVTLLCAWTCPRCTGFSASILDSAWLRTRSFPLCRPRLW